MSQKILMVSENYQELEDYIIAKRIKKIFLVCGKSFKRLKISEYFVDIKTRLGIEIVSFSKFQPNPKYEEVLAGLCAFRSENSDMIIAVGGGSAIDVAKCIKLYAKMNPSSDYLTQEIIPNDITLMAIPTTAGSGSEATSFAVIYNNGEKQSVAADSCLPAVVCFDATTLETVPIYHKKAAMMDALCHAIESFWSVNSTPQSKAYASEAITLIVKYQQAYLQNERIGNEKMLKASNLAGKAINITLTTAGHAMSYKLTMRYGLAHGHAAVICVARLWRYMISNIDNCLDKRGEKYLGDVLADIASLMGASDSLGGANLLQKKISQLKLDGPVARSDKDYEILSQSVEPTRLRNNPVYLDEETINLLYRQIVRSKEG